ncbi:MAG: hypothetical protein LBC07_00055 [Elusimicrobiota bacterium]|jgi:hypothetical protein|nr:hypothetical protein [Elusimicrobiota bacterium]
MILEILGAAIPLATNIVQKIAGVKEKKIEAENHLNDNDLKALEFKVKIQDSINNFEIERQKTIAQTFLTGNKIIDGASACVRVGFGLMALLVGLETVIAYIFKLNIPSMLEPSDIAELTRAILAYYLCSYSCKKVF